VKQVLQSYRTGELEVAEVPAPAAGPGEVLVRTVCSLVSAGTERAVMALAEKSLLGKARARPDLVAKVVDKVRREGPVAAARAAFARLDQPVALGYSCAGEVVEVGAGLGAADGFAPGEMVACAGAQAAHHAELNAVPRNLCARLPAGVSAEQAAFVTVGAIALHGVRLAELTLGERVLVVGAGLVGQLAAQIARASGCRVHVVDPDAARVEVAARLGAQAGPIEGADAVIVCASGDSNDPLETAVGAARDRARIVAVGDVRLDVPRRAFYDKELSLRVSRGYGPGRYDPVYEERGYDYPLPYVRWTEGRNLDAFLELLADGRVRTDALVTHRFPIERAEDAYALIKGGGEPFLGVLITYPGTRGAPRRTVDLRPPAAVASGKVGVAFVGAGAFASSVLVPAVASAGAGADLRVIVSAKGVNARHLGQRHGFQRASTSFDEAIADPAVHAVFIATRHHLHAEQAARALEAGKDAFVEKPPALTRAELQRVIAAARSSGRRLMVGYNRRFSPLAEKLRAHFTDREGPLVMGYRVAAPRIPPEHWTRDPAQGGGRLVGEACHFIDLLAFVCGALPVQVFAAAPAGAPDEDVLVTLRFADGSVGNLAYGTGGDAALPKERLEVHGGAASAILDDFRTLELWRGGKRKRIGGMGQEKGHREEVQAFLRAVREGAPSPLALDAIAASSEATFAALDSLASGAPVALGPVP
jgi:polar amino acid transport system substrate-binding protein